jgi:integrase
MTGMRKGEILALQWKDIDFDEDVIHVTKSVGHQGDRPFIKEPKTEAGTRIVPLLADLKEFLLTFKKRRADHYIISDDGKTPLTNRRYLTLSKHFKEQTGVECTAHQLRHSFATIAFENDVDAKSIQEIIGHKQLSTTMDIYADFREQSVKKAAEKLNKSSLSTPKK